MPTSTHKKVNRAKKPTNNDVDCDNNVEQDVTQHTQGVTLQKTANPNIIIERHAGAKQMEGDTPTTEITLRRQRYSAVANDPARRLHREADITVKKRVASRALTPEDGKEQIFCRYVLDGMSPDKAYRAAFDRPDVQQRTAKQRAAELLARPDLACYIRDYRAALDHAVLWTRTSMVNFLHEIAQEAYKESHSIRGVEINPETGDEQITIIKPYNASAAAVALKAVEMAAKMLGVNEPEQVEHSVKIEMSPELEELSK